MPTTVYLIRHGETDANLARRVQGRGLDMPLNATGEAQAARLGDRFTGVPLTAVHASPLVRARQTAEAIATLHGLPVATDPDLEEIGWGVLEGQDDDAATAAAFAHLYAHWEAGDFDVRLEGGESVREVQARAHAAWGRILDAHAGVPDAHVAVVSHGRTIRVLLATLLRRDDAEALAHMHDYQHANTSVNVLVVEDDGTVRADLLNCIAHLPGALRTIPPTTGRTAGSFAADADATDADTSVGGACEDAAATESLPPDAWTLP